MTNQEASGDLISRQAVIDIVDSYSESQSNVEDVTQDIISDIMVLSSVNPQEPSVVFVKTEESNDNDTKYLNINVSDDEVKRNPDIVRLCSDVGILEYVRKEQ